jgi:hypothetical protein
MPTVKDKITGEVVAEIDYDNPNAEAQAEQMVQGSPNLEVDYAPGGEYNAPDMRENYQLGGKFPGQVGFGERPMVNPLPSPGRLPGTAGYIYEEGGKVDKYKKKK